MAGATTDRIVTGEEFLKLVEAAPEDVTLELIRGHVREIPTMTTRGPRHAMAIARFSHKLIEWVDEHEPQAGVVASGEVRCRLSQHPSETIVGIDVAYFEGVEFVELPEGAKYFDGPPVVAVEVLSPSDRHEDVNDRIRSLLAAGVRQVWVADPDFRSVIVHRPDAEQQLFTAQREFDAEPELPGFRPLVASLFEGQRTSKSS
jgi:Uma2 family endonuclease